MNGDAELISLIALSKSCHMQAMSSECGRLLLLELNPADSMNGANSIASKGKYSII